MNIQSKMCINVVLIIFFSILFFLYCCAANVNVLFAIMLIVWFLGFGISLSNVKKHIVLLCFLISFFVFLLGREICFVFFSLERYYEYLEPYNNITFNLISISLLFLYVGYFFPTLGKTSPNKVYQRYKGLDILLYGRSLLKDDLSNRWRKIRIVAGVAYFFCYIMSLADVFLQIVSVRALGYLGTYIGSNVKDSSWLGYFSSFTIVAISIYLATLPPKRSSLCALFSLEIYGMLTMLTGHRYTFIAISMMCLTYVVFRHKLESNWISKKIVVMLIASIPIILIIMNYMDAVRVGKTAESGAVSDSIVAFLDQQGGSINVIKRIFFYKKQLSDMYFTSLSNLRTVLFENLIIRKLFHIKVYSGNSIENAFLGHYLSHRLSYYEYGNAYLTGHGVGSCYIAELFHDFGIFGVCIGNVIYGILLNRITTLQSKHCIINGLLIASQYHMFLAPRGDFDGMVGGLFTVTSILGIISIFVISKFIRGQYDHV